MSDVARVGKTVSFLSTPSERSSWWGGRHPIPWCMNGWALDGERDVLRECWRVFQTLLLLPPRLAAGNNTIMHWTEPPRVQRRHKAARPLSHSAGPARPAPAAGSRHGVDPVGHRPGVFVFLSQQRDGYGGVPPASGRWDRVGSRRESGDAKSLSRKAPECRASMPSHDGLASHASPPAGPISVASGPC